jgi:hypothetical protein
MIPLSELESLLRELLDYDALAKRRPAAPTAAGRV